jgi:hypothetical protein
MEGPDSIKKPSINLSTQIAAAGAANAANQISEDGVSAAEGKHSAILRNGATVNGSGKPEAAAGQALLGMMANNIVPTNGFFRGKTQEKESVKSGANIETHAAAFLADGPEAKAKFTELMTRASRGAESSSRTVSPHEVELGKQAVIPLDGPDAQFKDLLRSAFRLAAGRHAPITEETIINSFHEAQK